MKSSEARLDFLEYLIENELWSEAATMYARISAKDTFTRLDSLTYSMAFNLSQDNFDSRFLLDHISGDSPWKDRASNLQEYLSIKQLDLSKSSTQLIETEWESEPVSYILNRTAVMLANPEMVQAASGGSVAKLCERMNAIQQEYLAQPHYSPLLAATLSTVVPGAGKWYTSGFEQFLASFLPNAFLMAQAAEGYFNGGLDDPRFIIFGSLGSVFYIGNIFSSAKSAKLKNKYYYEEYHHELINAVDPFIFSSLRAVEN